jgi:hypothetical protein
MTKRINHNDLSHWFLRDHATLPAAYVKKITEFFQELDASSKRQASSGKQQVTAGSECGTNKLERKK